MSKQITPTQFVAANIRLLTLDVADLTAIAKKTAETFRLTTVTLEDIQRNPRR